MITYDQFIAEWNTKQVTAFGGECVALISQYEAENNLPIVWGNACQWANNVTMLKAYDWVQNDPNDPNQAPNRGNIIVWGADLPYADGDGHIAFFDRAIDNQNFMTFGQNSGGAQAHFQEHSWAYVAGWYVPRTNPPVPTYTKTTIPAKQIVFNKDSHLYNLSLRTIQEVADPANYVGNVVANPLAPLWVDGIIHHVSGNDFYTHEEPFGYAIQDCSDYVPPEPPKPYVAPPGAATVPLAQTFPLVTTVMYYNTKDDAKAKANPVGTVSPSSNVTYYVFATDGTAVQLGTSNQKAQYWINRLDNTAMQPTPIVDAQVAAIEAKPEPVVVAATPVISFKESYRAFHPGTAKLGDNPKITVPDIYTAQLDGEVEDLSGQANFTVPLTAGHKYQVYGWFTWTNGKRYYLLRIPRDTEFTWWFAVPFTYESRAVLTKDVTWLDKLFNRTEQLKSIFTTDLHEGEKYIDGLELKLLKRRKR